MAKEGSTEGINDARESMIGSSEQILTESFDIDSNRRDFLKGALSALLTFSAATSPVTAAVHQVLSDNEEGVEDSIRGQGESFSDREKTTPEREINGTPVYNTIIPIIGETTYSDPEFTGGRFSKLAEVFREMARSKSDKFYYYTMDGEIVAEISIPEKGDVIDWDGEEEVVGKGWPLPACSAREKKKRSKYWTPERKQAFHNLNRVRTAVPEGIVIPDPTSEEERKKTGYPIASIILPVGSGCKLTEGESALGQIKERLDEELADVRYFDGESIKLGDAIERIAEEYGVPVAIAKGLGAQESSFHRGETDKRGRIITTKSTANALGIYQFLPATAEELAKPFLKKNSSFRSRDVGTCSAEINNRFVQTELFCAHYAYLRGLMKTPLENLYSRLREIDPSFSTDLSDLAITASYNAGPGRVKRMLNRFVDLSDEEVFNLIGQPPYGLDVWLGVLANSFGADGVGPHVFHYSLKVFAWAGLLSEDDPIEPFLVERPAVDTGDTGLAEFSEDAGNVALSVLALGAGAAALTGVASGASPLVKKLKGDDLDRRDFLKLAAGTTGAAVLFGPSIVEGLGGGLGFSCNSSEKQKGPEYVWDTLPLNHLLYAEVVYETRTILDEQYRAMRKRGSFDYTKAESLHRRQYLLPQQYELIKDVFNEALGEGFKPKKWKKAVKKHTKWTKEQLEDGSFTRLAENDPSKPYFAQQVGKGGGRTDNDYDSLIGRKEFEPLMGTLVALVNYQIDLFNSNPKAYGYGDLFIHDVTNKDGSSFIEHAKIPHISAIKISGASRTLKHQYKGIGAMAAKTLPSAHTVGHALDVGALTRQEEAFKIVKFIEPFVYNGVEEIPAGGKLSATGFGSSTRVILSRMIGRAFMAMEGPMKEEQGITLQPLWESYPQNWHVVVKPAGEEFQAEEPRVIYRDSEGQLDQSAPPSPQAETKDPEAKPQRQPLPKNAGTSDTPWITNKEE